VDEYEGEEEGAGFVSACVLVLDVLFPHHPHINHHHTVVHEEEEVVLHVRHWHHQQGYIHVLTPFPVLLDETWVDQEAAVDMCDESLLSSPFHLSHVFPLILKQVVHFHHQ